MCLKQHLPCPGPYVFCAMSEMHIVGWHSRPQGCTNARPVIWFPSGDRSRSFVLQEWKGVDYKAVPACRCRPQILRVCATAFAF